MEMIETGAKIGGNTVLFTAEVGDRCLILTADNREYVSGWLMPEVKGMPREWMYGHYRQRAVAAVDNFVARYSDAGGEHVGVVRQQLTEAISAWSRG